MQVKALAGLHDVQLIRCVMESSDNVITHEGHSTVLRSEYNDIDVAAKHWNCDTSMGLEMLLNEIHVCEQVVSKPPHLLGKVLPRVIALWKEPSTDAVVVAENVGEGLTKPADGPSVLQLGGTVLDAKDCVLLREAAFDAFEILHRTGLRHNDIHERNIRASREVGEGGRVTWKVCFLDFGLACSTGDLDEAE